MALQPFRRVYNHTDFGFTAAKTVQPSMWNNIGSKTVPAQQHITFGYGGVRGVDTRGQLYMTTGIDSSAVNAIGKVRFALSNANETNVIIVAEERTERLSADQNDRTKCVLMSEYPQRAREDSKLIIYYYPDSASAETFTASSTRTIWLIPVTVYQ